MISIRLPENLEEELNKLVKSENTTKTEIVKNALNLYIENIKIQKAKTPYELGKEFFGKYESKEGDLSTTYKTKLKEKLSAKYDHR